MRFLEREIARKRSLGKAARIVVRVPHIPDFNTDEDVSRTLDYLTALGITRIDEFTYQRRLHE